MSVNAQLLLFNFTPKIMQEQVFKMSNVWHCIHSPWYSLQGVTTAAGALIGERRGLLENLHHSYQESVELLGFTITLLRALG
jgi:hypothetical protein